MQEDAEGQHAAASEPVRRYPPSNPKTPPARAGTKNSVRAHLTYSTPPGAQAAAASAGVDPACTIAWTSGPLRAAIAGLMISGHQQLINVEGKLMAAMMQINHSTVPSRLGPGIPQDSYVRVGNHFVPTRRNRDLVTSSGETLGRLPAEDSGVVRALRTGDSGSAEASGSGAFGGRGNDGFGDSEAGPRLLAAPVSL